MLRGSSKKQTVSILLYCYLCLCFWLFYCCYGVDTLWFQCLFVSNSYLMNLVYPLYIQLMLFSIYFFLYPYCSCKFLGLCFYAYLQALWFVSCFMQRFMLCLNQYFYLNVLHFVLSTVTLVPLQDCSQMHILSVLCIG